jgi:hypothetical protein
MKEHLVMHVSHTGLPFSAAVAAQTAAFPAHGRFNSGVGSGRLIASSCLEPKHQGPGPRAGSRYPDRPLRSFEQRSRRRRVNALSVPLRCEEGEFALRRVE